MHEPSTYMHVQMVYTYTSYSGMHVHSIYVHWIPVYYVFMICMYVFIYFSEEEAEVEREEGEDGPYHTIVLDCAPITFVDSTGIAMLEQVT